MSKTAIVSVSNDLATDQRVARVCSVLSEENYDVRLIGRHRKNSLSLKRPYRTRRFRLLFNKGALFYAELNFRLFWYLLFRKADLLYANDLDTLFANYLVSKLKRLPLIYDSHEYFTEVPELVGRKFARGTWLRIERHIFPKLRHVITVNNSIADIYKGKYGVDVKVVRNVPPRGLEIDRSIDRNKLGLPEHKRILILQGSGINVDRGGEELIQAMTYLDDYFLLVLGSGDVINQLKKMTSDFGIGNRVKFIDKLPYHEMMTYTINADLGITLDKSTNLNYRYSLPNKLFDYIKAEIPILSSDLIEVSQIIKKYNIGIISPDHIPENIAQTVKEFFANPERIEEAKRMTRLVQEELCWELEKETLTKMVRQTQTSDM